jgi:hypothetical protein
MFNFNIYTIIIETVIYIFVTIITGFILRGEELKKIKRVILIFYLIIGIAVNSVLYFILLSAGVLLAAAAIFSMLD